MNKKICKAAKPNKKLPEIKVVTGNTKYTENMLFVDGFTYRDLEAWDLRVNRFNIEAAVALSMAGWNYRSYVIYEITEYDIDLAKGRVICPKCLISCYYAPTQYMCPYCKCAWIRQDEGWDGFLGKVTSSFLKDQINAAEEVVLWSQTLSIFQRKIL